jgi:hypothetical protein
MKRSILFAILAIGSLIAAQGGWALAQDASNQNQSPSSSTTSTTIVSGTIVASNPSSLAIKSDAGAQLTFTLDGATALPAGMSPGDRIDVQYEFVAGEPLHALRVTEDKGGVVPAADGASGADPSSATATRSDGSVKKMPHTASWMPLIALMGTLSLGASLALRKVRRSRV